MKNTVYIKSDDVNVYFTATVQARKIGKIILTILNVGVLALYVILFGSVDEKEVGQFIIPAILMFFIFIFIPWKYWFWNFYGKETTIVNTKTISFFNDYGIIVTKPKTIEHYKGLLIHYQIEKEFDTIAFGKLHFSSYDPDTNLPKELYQTNVLISKPDADEIVRQITDLFNRESKAGFTFSVN